MKSPFLAGWLMECDQDQYKRRLDSKIRKGQQMIQRETVISEMLKKVIISLPTGGIC